jgi:hypothetical protein
MRALGIALQVFLFLALIFASLLVGGLITNRLPLTDPPGVGKRLSTYLGTHVAETTPDSEFPELRLRRYQTPPELLFDIARRAVEGLRWETAVLDADKKEIQAVVTTKIWHFKDDVAIQIQPAPQGGSSLYVRSVSRVGKGDLGANSRHVMDLHARVESILPPGALVSPGASAPPESSESPQSPDATDTQSEEE